MTIHCYPASGSRPDTSGPSAQSRCLILLHRLVPNKVRGCVPLLDCRRKKNSRWHSLQRCLATLSTTKTSITASHRTRSDAIHQAIDDMAYMETFPLLSSSNRSVQHLIWSIGTRNTTSESHGCQSTHGGARVDREPLTGRRARAPSLRCRRRSLSAAPKWGRRKDVAAPEKLSPRTGK